MDIATKINRLVDRLFKKRIETCEASDVRMYDAAYSMDPQDMNARFRLCWALVHSTSMADIERGIQLSQEFADAIEVDNIRRKLLYFVAVGHFKTGSFEQCSTAIAQCNEGGVLYWRALKLSQLVAEHQQTGLLDVTLMAGALAFLGSIVVVGAFSFVPRSAVETAIPVPELSEAFALKEKLEIRLSDGGFSGLCVAAGASAVVAGCFRVVFTKYM